MGAKAGLFGILIVVIVLIVYRRQRQRGRRARLRQCAATRGWIIAERPPPPEWVSMLPGWNRKGVSLLLSGNRNGRPVCVAEYHLTVHVNPIVRTRHQFAVAVVRLDEPHPPVAVRPRGALSRWGRTVFGDEPAVTGDAEFDEQFRVTTTDPEHSRALLRPALLTEHVSGRAPAWSVFGYDLVTWRPGRLNDPAEPDALAGQVVWIVDLLDR